MLPRFSEIIATLLARGIAMVGPFAVSIITARVLGPEDRGLYFLVISYAQIASQFANLGLHSSNTYLGAARPDIIGRLVVNSLYVAFIVAPLVALVVVLLLRDGSLFGVFGSANAPMGGLVFVAVLLAPLLVAFLYVSNLAVAAGRIVLFNGLTIFAGFSVVSAAGAVALAGGGTLAFLLAAAGALAVNGIVGTLPLIQGKSLHFIFDFSLFLQGTAFAFRAYFATLFGFLLTRIGVIALQTYSSFNELGQFSVAVQISDAATIIPQIVALLLFPSLVRTPEQDRWGALWKAVWKLALFMAVVCVGLALILPWAIQFVFGDVYEPATPMALALLPGVFLISVVSMLSQYLAAQGFPVWQVIAWIAGFAVQAVLSFTLAQPYGAMGVAIAQGISSATVLAILLVTVFGEYRKSNSRSSLSLSADAVEPDLENR